MIILFMNYGRLFKAESFDYHNLHRPVLGGGHDPVPVPQQAGGSRPRMSNRLLMKPVYIIVNMHVLYMHQYVIEQQLRYFLL